MRVREGQSVRSSLDGSHHLRDKSIGGDSHEERQARMHTITEDSRATANLKSQGHHPDCPAAIAQELGELELTAGDQ